MSASPLLDDAPRDPSALGFGDALTRVETATTWYRVEARRIAPPLNDFDEPMGRGRIEVDMFAYPVIRETPKGVWLDAWGNRRFVLRDARKRWACPTPEEAVESFRARKERQIRILHAQIADAEIALYRAETQFHAAGVPKASPAASRTLAASPQEETK